MIYMKNNRNNTHAQTPADLLNDLRMLISDAEKIVGDSIGAHSEEALAALRARFATAQEKCSVLYEGARRNVVAGAQHTDQTIRANPYESLGIALGAGVLLGVLLGRRSSSGE